MELNFFKDNNACYSPETIDEWTGINPSHLIDKKQPEKICINCAYEFGYWTAMGPGLNKAPTNLIKSNKDWTYGNCEVCGKEANLTKPKYYGHLYAGWQDKKKWN